MCDKNTPTEKVDVEAITTSLPLDEKKMRALRMHHNQNEMPAKPLSDFVQATAQKYGILGVAVGVWADGREIYACEGVTSIDNPLSVDRDTLFVLGSVTKTYTATALMCLVAPGLVELKAPARQYVPELKLKVEG